MPEEDRERIVEIAGHRVAIAHDSEEGIWFVRASTVPGLAAEAASEAELVAALEVLVRASTLP